MKQGRTVAVVGGGAAGLVAAVAAAERGCAVTVYEATDRVGRPILASGNGRCNFSNSMLDPARYHNAPFAQRVLEALNAAAAEADGQGSPDCALPAGGPQMPLSQLSDPNTRPALSFFARHGLTWAEEGQGRLYPASRKATSVLDVLRFAAKEAGVEFCCSMNIASIECPRAEGKPFTLRTCEGEFKRADAVIVAVGGTIARALLPDGVAFAQQRPVLGPLATNTDIVRALDNTRARVEITLCDAQGREKARERGEILFRKYGVSGIAVFNLSRFAVPGDRLLVHFLPETLASSAEGPIEGPIEGMPAAPEGSASPEQRIEATERYLQARMDLLGQRYRPLTVEGFFRGLFTGVLAEALCKQAGVAYESPLLPAHLPQLAAAVAAFPLMVEGIGDAKQCQVHRGGVEVHAVDASTMQLHGLPGLYVVGEALDVDGPCGGYNLHWAWSTALLAGLSCSR